MGTIRRGRFELQQVVAASGVIVRIAAMKHQSFAAGVDDLLQLLCERGVICDPELMHGLGGRSEVQLFECAQSLIERAGIRGQIEHHESHRAPRMVIRIGIADGTRKRFE